MINADSTLLAKVRAFVFHARNYAKRLGTWLRSEDIKPVRQIVCVLAVAYLGIRFAPFALETNIRWAGLFLQLLGVVSVMHGLVGKGKVFDVPHPIGAIRRWWTKRPLWVQNVNVPLTGVAACGEVADVLSATAQTDASVEAAIDER